MPEATSASPVVELRNVEKRFGRTTAVEDLNLELRRGELLALLGPSGCGKTTTLRMLAGLEDPTNGEIRIGGNLVADGNFSLAPERRGLGMVFQTYALWPHMNVFGNVAFALKRAGVKGEELRSRVISALEMVGMTEYVDREIGQLSGGQQQRVAVARALATRPELLLMDEPLSNLDAVLRESMRFEIRQLQQEHEITTLYVTHSQEEAMALADSIGVMQDGHLIQVGPPEEVYALPRTSFVATFIGLANVLDADVLEVSADGAMVRLGTGEVVSAVGHPEVLAKSRPGDSRQVAVRPENTRLRRADEPTAGDGLEIEVRIASAVFSGATVDYFVESERLGRIRVQAPPSQRLAAGQVAHLVLAPGVCVLLDD